jgi:ABC-type dipeptide/oligopeptide/nickel transport system permease component
MLRAGPEASAFIDVGYADRGVPDSDYIRITDARGLPARVLYCEHALANPLVPLLTLSRLEVGSVIVFSIITESVFQWPGLGQLFIESIRFSDVPVLAAYLIRIALVFVTVNLIVDIGCQLGNPRLRERGRGT